MGTNPLAELLSERRAITNLEETGRTATSTLYRGSSAWGTTTEAVELFDAPLTAAEASDADSLTSLLPATEHPAIFAVRDCGVTGDNQLYVVREMPAGSPLRSLVESRSARGQGFDRDEVATLLGPVAEAIDAVGAHAHPVFLSRSINVDAMRVQPGSSWAPIRLDLVGPAPGAGARSAHDNVEAFAQVVAALLGEPADPQRVAAAAGAADYLRSLRSSGPSDPANRWGASSAPEPVNDRPRQYFPETDPGVGMPAVAGYGVPYAPLASYQPAPPERKRRAWPWVLAAVLLLAAAGAGGGYWWYTQYYQGGEPWQGANSEIQADFPGLVSAGEGGKGWEGLTCSGVEAGDNQDGKIRCANADLGVSITKFTSAEARDSSLPKPEAIQVIGNDTCQLLSFGPDDIGADAYLLAPTSEKEQYTVLINGQGAEDKMLTMPVCG